MPAFRDVIDVPLVVRDMRRSRKQVLLLFSCLIYRCILCEIHLFNRIRELVSQVSRVVLTRKIKQVIISALAQVRKDIGVSEDVTVLLFNFGGQVVFLS